MASPDKQVLAQLKDIHLPEPIGWWPLAPGWYLLMALSLITVVLLIYYLWRRYINTLSKKQALKLLAIYHKQYQQDKNAQLACARISELLKRVALVYFSRHEVAGLTGQAWVAFLDKTAKKTSFQSYRYELIELPYSRTTVKAPNQDNINNLFLCAAHWIRQRSKPCLN